MPRKWSKTSTSGISFGFTCPSCGKQSFDTRKDAKKVIRQRGGHVDDRSLRQYRCPEGRGWHLGHQPMNVNNGEWPKDAWLGRNGGQF